MLDFSELSRDGRDLEQLTRELLFSLGTAPFWTGKGPDDGRDLICIESVEGPLDRFERRWVVSCKHKHDPLKAVGVDDLDDIATICEQHEATGYLLVCTTHPSSAVVSRLKGITDNPRSALRATYWDGVKLERLLRTPRAWAIAEQFLPKSAAALGWFVHATESPSRWIATHGGHYFHLTSRIGSRATSHFDAADSVLGQLKRHRPKGRQHHLRLRGLYYDDKNGAYTIYVDYLLPEHDEPALDVEEMLFRVNDGYAAEDGQVYHWDLATVRWRPNSEHADRDHDSYYSPFLNEMQSGQVRRRIGRHSWPVLTRAPHATAAPIAELAAQLRKLPSVARVGRVIDCKVEQMHLIRGAREWQEVVADADPGHFLCSEIFLEVADFEEFASALEQLPLSVEQHFSVSRRLIFTPDGLDRVEDRLYSLRLQVHPELAKTPWDVRRNLDAYASELADAVRTLVENALGPRSA